MKESIITFSDNMQKRLKHAINTRKIIPVYQPKVDSKTNAVIGAETLSRWVDGNTVILPNEYIHVAEATGLIKHIDLLSFERACYLIQTLKHRNILPPGFRVSSNFSVVTLKHIDFDDLDAIMDDYDIFATYLSIEISEHALNDLASIKPLLQTIVNAGIILEVDDFSNAIASYDLLQSLQIDDLKIGQVNLPKNTDDVNKTTLYETLVDAAKHINCNITAKGIETQALDTYIKTLNINAIQGFYHHKPLDEKSFVDLMKRQIPKE